MHDDDVRRQALVAMKILLACKIYNEDFFELSTTQVDALLEWADKENYRKPRNANGSRARYYHARLKRQIESWNKRLNGEKS